MDYNLPIRKAINVLLNFLILLGTDVQCFNCRLVSQEEMGALKCPRPIGRPCLAL